MTYLAAAAAAPVLNLPRWGYRGLSFRERATRLTYQGEI